MSVYQHLHFAWGQRSYVYVGDDEENRSRLVTGDPLAIPQAASTWPLANVESTLTTLKYLSINHGEQKGFFQFEINDLVCSFRFIWRSSLDVRF